MKVTIISVPDWAGGRQHKAVLGEVAQDELQDFEYIEWEGDSSEATDEITFADEFHPRYKAPYYEEWTLRELVERDLPHYFKPKE